MSKRFWDNQNKAGRELPKNTPGGATPSDDDTINPRIATAGRRMREEAKWLLEQEKPVRKLRSSLPPGRLPVNLAAGLTEEEKATLVEVMDQSGSPLACLRPEAAIRQKLAHRLVSVALCRRPNKLVLHKRTDARLGNHGCWDIHTAFVLVGEAYEDAALRILRWIGLDGLGVKFLVTAPSGEETTAHVSYYVADLPVGLHPANLVSRDYAAGEEEREAEPGAVSEPAEALEVDKDELAGITGQAPELFSRELLWVAKADLLFS